jgi:hypothetical protein
MRLKVRRGRHAGGGNRASALSQPQEAEKFREIHDVLAAAFRRVYASGMALPVRGCLDMGARARSFIKKG